MGLYLGYVINLVIAFVAAAAVFAFWVANRKRIAAETVGRAEEQALRTLKDAERDADTRKKEALLEAKEKAHEMRTEAERVAREKTQHLGDLEQQLHRREQALTDKLSNVDRKEKDLQVHMQTIGEKEKAAIASAAKYEQLVAAQQHELERLSGLTTEEAKHLLLQHIEADARRDAANLVKRLDAEAREQAGAKARQYITEAIQRSAAEHTIETTVSVVDLPSDDLKGRIIGREGRNIRALELATGVDLIVDDTPEAVILSGFDPIRREIARISLERLMQDGRIHPARIEELVEKVRQELDQKLFEEGEAAAFSIGLTDLHPEVLKLLGRLRYRTSYGQNVLVHSLEVAQLAALMAVELGVNDTIAKRGGLLHDIGKAIDREMEGTHLELGRQVLEKYGEKREIIHAMECHHGDYDPTTVEAVLVNAADALSAARPGARREILENYVHRLERLEAIANQMEGVAKSFAIQAGRELRIIVNAEKITDEQSIWLSKDVARKIESELQYPGQIKVTVIREMRAVDYAK